MQATSTDQILLSDYLYFLTFRGNVFILMICFLVGDVINLEIKDTLNLFEEVQITELY